MASAFFQKIFVGKRSLAIIIAIAVLFAGFDIHSAVAEAPHSAPDIGVVFAIDKTSSPDSEKASVTDHFCHGCVVFVAIDTEAAVAAPVTSLIVIGDTADLVGALPDFPARPPRTEIQLS